VLNHVILWLTVNKYLVKKLVTDLFQEVNTQNGVKKNVDHVLNVGVYQCKEMICQKKWLEVKVQLCQ